MINRRISLVVVLFLAVILGYAMRALMSPTTDALAQDAEAARVREEVSKARAELAKLGPPTRAFSLISKIVRPSVVSIVTTRKITLGRRTPFRFDGLPYDRRGERVVQGLGSGVVVDKDGHVLTNNHVVEGAEDITVVLADETEIKGEKVGTDPKTDLAVIRMIDPPKQKLVVAKLGDSGKLEVGDWVLAVGAPFGLPQSVSAGIVSALGRSRVGVIRNQYRYENFVQTDAAINRGNSGGPLVNHDAEVIGINTAIATGNGAYQGVGFAIPSNMAKNVMRQLIKTGRVVRGYLGVEIGEVDDKNVKTLKLPRREGVIVTRVSPGTPAEEAGLKPKDVIIAIDGTPTPRMPKLRGIIADTDPGKKITLKVIRGGKEKEIEVVIAEQPEAGMAVFSRSLPDMELGITVQTLTPELARSIEVPGKKEGVYAGEKGVIVTEVVAKGPAARAGIKQYDLIKQVANEDVANVTDYQRQRTGVDFKRKGVLLLVKSGDMVRLILVR